MSSDMDYRQQMRSEVIARLSAEMRPAFDLYSAGEYSEAVALLDSLLEECSLSQFSPEEAEIRRFNVIYTRLGFLASLHFDDPQHFLEIVDRDQPLLEKAADTVAGEAERLALYLRFVTSMDSAGFRSLPAEEFRRILADVPEEVQDLRFWHDIALWAFRNKVADALESAVECSLMQQSRVARESVWLRIHLMYRILRGEASELEVSNYIMSMRSMPQFDEFRLNIQTELERRGKWNSDHDAEFRTAFKLAQSRGFLPEAG